MNHLHETMVWLRADIEKRITDLEKRIAAHNTIAELCGESLLPSMDATATPSATTQAIATPKPSEPSPAATPVPSSGRVSKYIEPLVKCLSTGPKSLGEIEQTLKVAAGCFINQLQGRNDLFRKVGSGRGSKWELIKENA